MSAWGMGSVVRGAGGSTGQAIDSKTWQQLVPIMTERFKEAQEAEA